MVTMQVSRVSSGLSTVGQFFGSVTLASTDKLRLPVMICQNRGLGKCWKVLWATLTFNCSLTETNVRVIALIQSLHTCVSKTSFCFENRY